MSLNEPFIFFEDAECYLIQTFQSLQGIPGPYNKTAKKCCVPLDLKLLQSFSEILIPGICSPKKLSLSSVLLHWYFLDKKNNGFLVLSKLDFHLRVISFLGNVYYVSSVHWHELWWLLILFLIIIMRALFLLVVVCTFLPQFLLFFFSSTVSGTDMLDMLLCQCQIH